MSSHHIVREKQEPALLVLGMDSFADDLLGQLLEWSPTLISTADTAEQLISLGIKVDVVIDAGNKLADFQSDVKYIRAGENETTAVLQYLVDNGYPAVNIVTDLFLMDDYLPFADKINIVIYSGNKKIYPVSSGFSKWKPAGEVISILSYVSDLEVTGLSNIAADEFETDVDGLFSVYFTGKYLFISENIL